VVNGVTIAVIIGPHGAGGRADMPVTLKGTSDSTGTDRDRSVGKLVHRRAAGSRTDPTAEEPRRAAPAGCDD
jgi:hypothetical protein